jgi:hypothetical protein
MKRAKRNHFRMTAILLLAGACVVQLAGISQFQKGAKGRSQPAGQGNFMLADGPTPPPVPPPLPHVRFTIS